MSASVNQDDFQVFVPRRVVASNGDTGMRRYLNGRVELRPRQMVLGVGFGLLLYIENVALAFLDPVVPDIHKVLFWLSLVCALVLVFVPFGGVDSWTWFVRWLRSRREAKQGLHHLATRVRVLRRRKSSLTALANLDVIEGTVVKPRLHKGGGNDDA